MIRLTQEQARQSRRYTELRAEASGMTTEEYITKTTADEELRFHQRGKSSIEQLKALLASGNFHHATIRRENRLGDGLWFYHNDSRGLRGFGCSGNVSFDIYRGPKNNPYFDEATKLCAGTGISFGSYGQG